jgi:SAM-dependent methyltransferase
MESVFILARLRGVDWRRLGLRRGDCPACERRTWFLRLADDPAWVRCLRCRAGCVTLSLVAALNRECPEALRGDVYELSNRGPLVDYLEARAGKLVTSIFVEDAEPGGFISGSRCEDVQRLSFPAAVFDLVTSTEVFEHVADDAAGFCEVFRVLRPGGCFAFTVPLVHDDATVERARMSEEGIEHLLPPEFHTDPSEGGAPVLVFRDYGRDLPGRLHDAGFPEAHILEAPDDLPWGTGRPVVFARRAAMVKPVSPGL